MFMNGPGTGAFLLMCNLYSITTNQAAIAGPERFYLSHVALRLNPGVANARVAAAKRRNFRGIDA